MSQKEVTVLKPKISIFSRKIDIFGKKSGFFFLAKSASKHSFLSGTDLKKRLQVS